MNISGIARNLGITLMINAVFMALSLLVSILNGMDSAFTPMLISVIITTVLGIFPLIFARNSASINIKEGFVTAVMAWSMSCVLGLLPYLLWGGEFTFINALFESVSGYTTTGATILTDIESLPKSLLFWRSSTHFIGGVGVVLFMLLIIPSSMSSYKYRMSKMEISSLSKTNFAYKSGELVKIIVGVYLSITILTTTALMICGMSLYDAVNHAFSTVSTGGFSTKNLSIAHFDSPAIEIVLIISMLASGMHFGMLYSAVVERNLKPLKSPIVKYYLGIVFVAGLVITANLMINGNYTHLGDALRKAYFQVASIITCTGFAVDDMNAWPSLSIVIIVFLTMHCACSGSTASGIKVDRFLIFYYSLRAQIKKKLHPNAVVPVKIGDSVIDRDVIADSNQYMVLYLFVAFVCTLLLVAFGTGITESFTGVVTCMSNVGPGFGSVGSMDNFAGINTIGKIIYSIAMFLGRLEIFPVFITISLIRGKRV